MSHVSLGRPEIVPGTPPGHPTAKFLYVIFLYRFFSLHSWAALTCTSRRIGGLVSLCLTALAEDGGSGATVLGSVASAIDKTELREQERSLKL